MGSLIDQEIFSSSGELIREFARNISTSNSTVLIISEPNLNGSLSLAPIEASLLDSGIPYRRRFTSLEPDYEPFIQISEDEEKEKTSSRGLRITETVVEGLRGSSGDSRKGPLSTVVQAHSLANEINPHSSRLRRMRPWILSGNWISDALDNTYDPVYTFLRDYLSAEGAIRVVPVTEVKFPEFSNFSWLDPSDLKIAQAQWASSGIQARENIMGNLAKPILHRAAPSTPRAEELLWHCVLGSGWETDLSSQITRASEKWQSSNPMEAASFVVDSLVSKGAI